MSTSISSKLNARVSTMTSRNFSSPTNDLSMSVRKAILSPSLLIEGNEGFVTNLGNPSLSVLAAAILPNTLLYETLEDYSDIIYNIILIEVNIKLRRLNF